MRLPSKGFIYVYVETDGSVRQLVREERDYLLEEFQLNDSARPYIKLIIGNEHQIKNYTDFWNGMVFHGGIKIKEN